MHGREARHGRGGGKAMHEEAGGGDAWAGGKAGGCMGRRQGRGVA